MKKTIGISAKQVMVQFKDPSRESLIKMMGLPGDAMVCSPEWDIGSGTFSVSYRLPWYDRVFVEPRLITI